jgi:hypothetical protein
METVQKSVKSYFTEKEKRDIAEEMAKMTLLIEDLDAEKKAAMSSFKDKIDSASLAARVAAQKLRDGYEYRNIECEVVRDYEREEIHYVRTDTGETIESRKMEPAERQMQLSDVRESTN